MATAPKHVVNPPERMHQWHSLLSSAQVYISDDAEQMLGSEPVNPRWEGGFTFWPENCITAAPWNPCPVAPALSTVPKSAAPAPPLPIDYEPWIAETSFQCSTYGFEAIPYAERALNTLMFAKAKLIEQEYEFPTQPALPANVPQSLVGGTTTLLNGGAAIGPRIGLALLEQFLAECAGGNVGYIHAPAAVHSLFLVDHEVKYKEDTGRLHTLSRGDVLVSGAGYRGLEPVTGNAPAANQFWVYATGPVAVRLGQVTIVPDELSEAVTRSNNDIEYRAECPVAVYDDLCCRAAILIDITL